MTWVCGQDCVTPHQDNLPYLLESRIEMNKRFMMKVDDLAKFNDHNDMAVRLLWLWARVFLLVTVLSIHTSFGCVAQHSQPATAIRDTSRSYGHANQTVRSYSLILQSVRLCTVLCAVCICLAECVYVFLVRRNCHGKLFVVNMAPFIKTRMTLCGWYIHPRRPSNNLTRRWLGRTSRSGISLGCRRGGSPRPVFPAGRRGGRSFQEAAERNWSEGVFRAVWVNAWVSLMSLCRAGKEHQAQHINQCVELVLIFI